MWEFVSSNNGTYHMQNGLLLISDGTQSFSAASRKHSQYYASGDFDVQVDYTLDSTWNAAIVASGSGAHFQGATFAVYFDSQNSLVLFRNKTAGVDQLFLYGVAEGQTVATGIPANGLSGTLRIRRSGMSIDFMGLTGNSWTLVGNWTGPIRPAVFSLASANVNANNTVDTTFRNFQINSGATNFQPYQLPASPLVRPDFLPGFVSTDHLAWTVWGNFQGYDPFPIMFNSGIGRARIRITTVSDPNLATTPFSQWRTLPWNNDYWASLQMGEQELRQARSLGMQTYLELFLSDTAADASVQNAPAAWQGLSVDDTAAALQQYTYQTTSYFISRGIKIDLYAIGNEIGTGILNFRPGERLAAPQNASPYDAIEFMEQNVWPTEAVLLNAAIAGVRQADPNAKIVLHVAGLTLSPADLWTKAFFTTMVSLGVPFDVAGVSLPYMAPGWSLPQYPAGCWYQKLNAVFQEFAALGKQGIVAEGAYQNTTVNISANAPMPDFPVTPQGQAAWIADTLRFASNNPNVIGFNYTFPEALPGVFGPNPPVDINAYSLFLTETATQPGMSAFSPFIGSTGCAGSCPALTLTQTADASTVPDGSPIGYTLTVANTGAGLANSVTLNDPLPAGPSIGWSIVPLFPGPGICAITGVVGNQVLGCSFGNLVAGARVSVHVSSPTSNASCQTYANLPMVTADNNSSVQSNSVTTVQCVPLAISGPPALPAGAVGARYFSTTMTALGGVGAYTWSATGLPNGLGIDRGTGTITGTPTTTTGSPFHRGYRSLGSHSDHCSPRLHNDRLHLERLRCHASRNNRRG